MIALRPFFPYYGAKWRMGPHYAPPEFDSIIEPFGGAAGYSVRHHERDVLIVDRDPNIVNTWQYLIRATAEDILSLPLPEEFERVPDIDAPIGARALIGFWCNPGSAAPRNVPSKWVRSGLKPGSSWSERTRSRIASQVSHIRHWRVGLGSYEHIDDRRATWFIDPPYADAGKHYRFGSKTIDYDALGEWCRSRSGQVIVCENDGALWLPFTHLASVKGTAGSGRSGVTHEAVWTRLPARKVLK